MFKRRRHYSVLITFALLVQTSLTPLIGNIDGTLHGEASASNQTTQSESTVTVYVCVPQDLVQNQAWDHPEPGSKMSNFKDLLALYVLALGKAGVQYRVKPRAFENYDPSASYTPYAGAWLEEVSADQACPSTSEAYAVNVKVRSNPASATTPAPSAPPTRQPFGSLAQKCNALAAAPDDPNRDGSGVSLGQINVTEALPACEQVAAQQPVVPRSIYLYARVLQAAKRFPEAANQYLIAAQAGDPLAAIDLAGLYFEGIGVPKDYQQAARFCRQSADAGVPGAAYHLGFLYREGLGVPKDYTEASKWFMKAGEGGFPDAYAEAGRLYILGTPQDFSKAAAWFQKAVEQKSGLGALNLGLLHEYGKSVPQDFAAAEQLYRQAAEKGMPHAMYRLGVMYQNGEGVRRDDTAAAKWFYEAAKLGHADAQSELGYMFYNGLGTKQDYQNAFAWYIQAAQAGVVFAESSVASMYERGEGVKQDEAEAVAWFRKAADQNDPFAMTQLAVHLRQGSGVPWSEAGAMQWFRKAADQGYAPAETSLGYGYMAGLGQSAGQGQQDYRQAAYWFDLAARQGEGYAQLNLAILYEKGWGVSQDLARAKELYLQAARSPIPEVANNAKELVSTGPFAVSGSSNPSASPLSRQRESSSDWVGPVIGIGLVIGGAWALANLLSGPSTSTHDVAPTPGGTAQQSDYKDYVADAIQSNIARETAARETAAQEDRTHWERTMRCGNYHLGDCN